MLTAKYLRVRGHENKWTLRYPLHSRSHDKPGKRQYLTTRLFQRVDTPISFLFPIPDNLQIFVYEGIPQWICWNLSIQHWFSDSPNRYSFLLSLTLHLNAPFLLKYLLNTLNINFFSLLQHALMFQFVRPWNAFICFWFNYTIPFLFMFSNFYISYLT